MKTPPNSEGPEVAASEPSEPIAPLQNEGTTSMTQNPDQLTTWRALATMLRVEQIESLQTEEQDPHRPDEEDNRELLILWAADMIAENRQMDALHRLRSAVAEVDPARLTASDAGAFLDLIQAAAESESEFGRRMREKERERREAQESRSASIIASGTSK